MILHWNDEIFECDIAVRRDDKVLLYDLDYNVIREFFNISPSKWNQFTIEEGTWTDPAEIPTKFDYLQADIDFLQMENDALTMDNEQVHADIDFLQMLNDGLAMENEQLRADVDYCLMLLEEPEVEESNGSE